MKIIELLKEETLKGFETNILNHLMAKGYDHQDINGIYIYLTRKINVDSDIASKIALIYRKYAAAIDNFKDLKDYDLDYDPNEIDDKILALSEFLTVHPLAINDEGSYYKNVVDGDEYLVLDDSEADQEFESRADEYVDEMIYSDAYDWLESYVELDDYSVEQFAREEAENRVDDMDSDDIIVTANGQEELDNRISNAERQRERWYELDEEIVDVEDKINDLTIEIENLNEEMYDLSTEADSSEDRDETADLENEYEGMKESMAELKDKLEYWENHLEEIRYEFDDLDKDWDDVMWQIEEDLAQELKDELYEVVTDQIVRDIEHEGIDYFISNLGYSLSDAIEFFGYIDRESAIRDLEYDGRGPMISHYDGVEEEQDYNGETYYIYRMG